MNQHNDLHGTVNGGMVVQAGSVFGGVHIHSHRPSRRHTPWQVPPHSSRFVNRTAQIAELDDAVARDAFSVLLLTGPAGVGKSALARTWLWLWARCDRFPDGMLHVDLHDTADQISLYRALSALLRALDVAPDQIPADLRSASALWRSVTASRQLALLVDGAIDAESVQHLLPGPGALTVVTSTRRMTALVAQGAYAVPLEPLARPAAVALLERFIGPRRTAAEPDAADRLAALCADLPLALCLAGARLATDRKHSIKDLVHALTNTGPLQQLAMDGSTLMRDVIDDCYQQLPPGAARMYRVLGALPLASVTPHAAAAAAALPEHQAATLMSQLIDAHLLYAAAGSCSFYPLVAEHAREIARQQQHADETRDAITRATAWYLDCVINAAGTVRPHHHDQPERANHPDVRPLTFAALLDALDWLDREEARILALARHAEHADPRAVLTLVGQLWALFVYRKKYLTWEEADLLGLRCARALSDRDQEAKMLRRLGLLTSDLGRYAEAENYLTEAVDIFRQLGNERRATTALNTLGVVQLRQGRPEQAADTLTSVLETHRRRGDQRESALALIDLAATRLELGEPGTAIENLREAAGLLDGVSPDDEGTRIRLTTLLGRAHIHTGALQDAERELADALAGAQRTASPTKETEALLYLGELAARTGDQETARACVAEANLRRERAGIPTGGWLAAQIGALTAQADPTC